MFVAQLSCQAVACQVHVCAAGAGGAGFKWHTLDALDSTRRVFAARRTGLPDAPEQEVVILSQGVSTCLFPSIPIRASHAFHHKRERTSIWWNVRSSSAGFGCALLCSVLLDEINVGYQSMTDARVSAF